MPKPITPDMTDLPRQDSIAACIYIHRALAFFVIVAEGKASASRAETYGFDVGVHRAAGRRRRRTACGWEAHGVLAGFEAVYVRMYIVFGIPLVRQVLSLLGFVGDSEVVGDASVAAPAMESLGVD